jgi:PIN domain nuclease of toxin-antitoxin system
MKILLDTHAFLWWDSNPEKLAPPVVKLLSEPEFSKYEVEVIWE